MWPSVMPLVSLWYTSPVAPNPEQGAPPLSDRPAISSAWGLLLDRQGVQPNPPAIGEVFYRDPAHLNLVATSHMPGHALLSN